MSETKQVRVLLTQKLVESVDFERRVIGVKGKATLITEPTPPHVTDWLLRDHDIRGFALRVTRRSKALIVQRKMGGSESVKRTLGRWPDMSVEQARRKASAWLGLMASGKDPRDEKRNNVRATNANRAAAQQTMGRVFQDYIDAKKGSGRPATGDDRKKVVKWMEKSPLWRTPVHEVDHDALEKSLTPLFQRALNPALPKPAWGPDSADLSTAHKITTYLSTALSRHISKTGGERSSPFPFYMTDKQWPRPKARDSLLETGSEKGGEWLRGLLQECRNPEPHYRVLADYILCVVLWGGRRREVQLLRWETVDFKADVISFPEATTKSGRAHVFPMTPWAKEILEARKADNATWGRDGDFVFPSRHHGKPIADARVVLVALKERTGLWVRLHDLRRSLGTEMAEIEEGDPFLVSVALNHTIAGATARYIKKRAELLRPSYLARERRLRKIVGLPVEEVSAELPAGLDVEGFVALMLSNPAVERRFMDAYLMQKAKAK